MFKLHKYSCKKCIPALLIILFFIGLLPPNLYGQVKIKERVELNPKNTTQNPLRSLSDKWLEISIAPGRNSNEPITAGEIVDISIELCSPIFYGCLGIEMPPNQLFNATVTWNSFPGEDEDNVPYLYNNGVESFTLTNVQEGFKLKAPEYLQSYPLYATVTVSTIWDGETVSGYDEELIEQDTSIIVTFNPSTISVGDTVELVLQKMIYGGEIIPYHPLQQFEVGMLEGCINGHILVDDSTGSYFEQVTQPIYFVAADTLDIDTLGTDTARVLLRVGLNQDWSDPYVDQTELAYKRWLAKNSLSEADYPLKKVKVAPRYIESDCYTGSYVSWVYNEVELDIPKYIINLIYPRSTTSNEEISKHAIMPNVLCIAKLNTFYPGVIKYEWKYIVRKFYHRSGGLCQRISRSEFQGLSYSITGNGYTEWAVPFEKDSGYFYFKSLRHAKNKYARYNQGYGCDGVYTNWYDEDSDEIFTGGDVIISLIAKNELGETIAKIDTLHTNKIIGKNPDEADVLLQAGSNEIIAILKWESKSHFKSNGNPTYGPPNGFGRMQIDDPAATERQMWNWKANIEGGKDLYFTDKKPAAKEWLDKKGNYTTEQLLKTAFQKYNYHGKGKIWFYKWNGKKWIADDRIPYDGKRKINGKPVKYAEGVWNEYKKL